MKDSKKEGVLTNSEPKKRKKRRVTRDTVLTRVDRTIKEEVKALSKRRGQTMAWINDHALREYIDSVKALD